MVEFTKEEIGVIKERMSKITTHIPNNQAKWLWDTYKKIKGTNEKQPCSCGSSGNFILEKI
jgi:hypothetical protein